MDSDEVNEAEMEEDENGIEDTEEEDDDHIEEDGKTEESKNNAVVDKEVYLPGVPLEDGEELTFDKSAYVMYHAATTGAPCLSFDLPFDESTQTQTEFPMSCDIVCGTQSHGKPNLVLLMKMMNLTKIEEDSDSEDSYIEEEETQPVLYTLSFKHTGDVNRIRYATLGNKKIAATWSSVGNVHIWDLTKHFETLDANRSKTTSVINR